jgi:hypothetical protein
MGQVVRWGKERPEAYWETIRERIDAGKAVGNLNRMVDGIELPAQQERATLFIINKLLPSLQAVAVQVQHTQPASKGDIDALLLSSGIKPDLLPGWKKTHADPIASDPPPPPSTEADD